jgi:hypothetical protein
MDAVSNLLIAVRFIPALSTIFHDWHSQISTHIHYLSIAEDLEKASRPKNNLSDGELAMIFQYVIQLKQGVDNSKQHYMAMLFAWTTAARPGAFTVTRGYEKGAPTGVQGVVFPENQTLFWRDVDFVRFPDGIGARVTLRYHKGYRNPYAEKALPDYRRTFTFLPTHGTRYEFDLALIMFGIAINRRAFEDSLEHILAVPWDMQKIVPMKNEVRNQAVFVLSNQAGALEVDTPMRDSSLNPKLRAMCESVGLFEYNTYYSFRRTAIIETRRLHGTEAAKNLAMHRQHADTISAYDQVGLGDLDMTAYQLGETAAMDRSEIRKFFSQSATAIHAQGASAYTTTPKEALDARVKKRLPSDSEYVEVELQLKDIYDRMEVSFQNLKNDGVMPLLEFVPPLSYGHWAGKFTELALQYELTELSSELDALLAQRKAVHKKIRQRIRKEEKAAIVNEQVATEKANVQKAQQLLPGPGVPFKAAFLQDTPTGTSQIQDASRNVLQGLDDNDDDEGGYNEDEMGVDNAVLEEQDDGIEEPASNLT